MLNSKVFLLCIASIFWLKASGQKMQNIFYIEPNFNIGKIVPTNSFVPQTNFRYDYGINIGSIQFGDSLSQAAYYRFPAAGLHLSYTKTGNDTVYGQSFNALTYIELRPSRRIHNAFNFHLGIGASYYNTPFDAKTNPVNKSVGAHYTWSFKLFSYYNLLLSDKLLLKIGGGYLHSSTGHVKLPNFGLNSGAVSLSLSYLHNPKKIKFRQKIPPYSYSSEKHFTTEFCQGIGFHAFGGTSGPVEAPVDLISVSQVSAGIIFRKYFKFYGGIAYRFYNSYYKYIIGNSASAFSTHPYYSASNILLFLGTEFQIGRFGIDIKGGLNISKPFYRTFDSLHQNSKDFDYFLKRYFPSAMGLKFYILKPAEHPKNNLFVSAHINANFGEADFSEFSIGYLYTFEPNN